MKLPPLLILLFGFGLFVDVHASFASGPLWLDLPQTDGSVIYCDLTKATTISLDGDRVIVYGPFAQQGSTGPFVIYLRQTSHETAQRVRAALEASPDKWLQLHDEKAKDVSKFLNLEAVATVTFGSDKDGAFASVNMRDETSVTIKDGPEGHGAYMDPVTGYQVRDAANLQRLKTIVAFH